MDGDFWHGKMKEGRMEKLPDYWKNKISANMARDERQFEELVTMGVRPIRFYASELKKDPQGCYLRILKALEEEDGRSD